VEGTGSLGAERDSLSLRQQVTLSIFWFALNFQGGALPSIVIPAQVLLFVAPGSAGSSEQAVVLGWLSAVGAVIAVVVQPTVGALSDKHGRPPYILIGLLFLLAGMLGLGIAGAFVPFLIGYIVDQVGGSTATAAYQGVIPDRVPPEQRGAASGYLGLMTMLGTVGSLAIAGFFLGDVRAGAASAIEHGAAIYYLVSAGLLALTAIVTVMRLDDIPALPRHDPPRSISRLAIWLEPWHDSNFVWVFVTRGLVILGLTLFLTFIEYYFAAVAHLTHFVSSTAALAALALIGALVSSLILGTFSDRKRRAPIVCVATVFMAAAAGVFVVAPASIPLWPLGLIFGVGYGAYTSVDWALAVDALPSLESAGKDLGLWSVSSTFPAIIAPLIGSLVIGVAGTMGQTAAGYRAVFAVAVLCFIAGAIFVLRIDESRLRS